ncbi:uncharacterized protein LOC119397645 [Rhipicephalus sanguineus]|uniref:uncharacterized protein LOC119397645 n=1 Tax=Rhipicephalus sanguineus TaxID=34632 RepID=UPI0018938CEE|nr:uncharacterized protein LOC119397645 [Rhipicephalus sanguineus]
MLQDTPEDLPGAQPSRRATSRKRGNASSDTDSEATDLYSEGFESSDDDFKVVMSRTAKRRLLRTTSSASVSTVKTAAQRRPHTMLFMPEDPASNLRLLNRQVLSVLLEETAPNQIKDVRINARKNVLAVDVLHRSALQSLRYITVIDKVKVRSMISTGCNGTVGVIYDVDLSIPPDDLPVLIKSTTEGTLITHITRLGNSRCLRLVFEGDSLPSHVKVGHVRHSVRPYVPKPLQCYKCFKIGHVRGVCGNNVVCPRCAESHSKDACGATVLRCPNCHGAHEASSKDCPRLRNEHAVLKRMVRDNSTHREAAATLRRRRRRHRRTSRKDCSADSEMSSSIKAAALRTPNSSKTDTAKSKAETAVAPSEEWPSLPQAQPATASHRIPPPSTTQRTTDATTEDRQVVNLLQSLISAMPVLLSNMKTPSAQSALQVLDTLSPVLAALG